MKYILLIILVLILTSCVSQETSEAELAVSTYSCPRGEVDCEYPGRCPLYNDLNENNICDNSEI